MDRETLMELRRLRLDAQYHNAKAAEYMARATYGTSTRRATNMSGTGDCPLSTWAERYSIAKAVLVDRRKRANEIWAKVEPLLADADFDAESLIALYYNQALTWEDTKARLKRSDAACQRMHREMLQRLEGLL